MENKYETLQIESSEYKTEFNEKFKNRKIWETPDPKKIHSYIPGQILEIFVIPGQKVNAGSEILILEAMKMRNRIITEIAGTIKSVYIKEGQNIPKNFLMVELE
jgi:biotin carboxyl carrier protein